MTQEARHPSTSDDRPVAARPERKVPVWLSAAGAVVAVLSALTGLYFAWWPRTPVRTLAQWSREATAVCEQYRGDLATGYREAQDELSAVLDRGKGTGKDAADALDGAANVYRGMVGRVRAVTPPSDGPDADLVAAALGQTERLDEAWAAVATSVESLDVASAAPSQLEAVVALIDRAQQEEQATAAAFERATAKACGIT